MTNSPPEEGSVEDLCALALGLLAAVDDGRPAVALARGLAVEVLRQAEPDTDPWLRAIDVLEAGPLRVRRAVDLAGLLLEGVEGERSARSVG